MRMRNSISNSQSEKTKIFHVRVKWDVLPIDLNRMDNFLVFLQHSVKNKPIRTCVFVVERRTNKRNQLTPMGKPSPEGTVWFWVQN